MEGTKPFDWEPGVVSRVPYRVFLDETLFEQEQEKIFRGPLWSFVGAEAELPQINDFKTTYVGRTPIVVTRTAEGTIAAWVNRCAHRGALVTRELRGNKATHECVYHQWSFSPEGSLIGVPFRRGIRGQGGMPADFDLGRNGLQKLRVAVRNGVIFVSFDDKAPPLEEFLGAEATAMLDRVTSKPMRLLGYQRQRIRGNWKAYLENVRDPYHASLLHLFYPTFGLYRSTQQGHTHVSGPDGMHSMLCVKSGTDQAEDTKQAYAGLRSYQEGKFELQDKSILRIRKEFPDDFTIVIMGIFPALVVHQIANTIALRQVIPLDAHNTLLIWHYFGYEDDDADLRAIRLKLLNYVGPAGFISMEDGEAVELVDRGVRADPDATSIIEMGGKEAGSAEHMVTESAIRSMWQAYRRLMKI